jgi:acid stress-induced BolA-like protein IbaG/YrbA
MTPAEIQKMIEAGLPNAIVRVESADDTHFQALVVSDAFTGQRPLARHQLVYRCLGDRMGNEIHALSIRAYTGPEWTRLGTTDDGTG